MKRPNLDAARRVAAGIPGARLVILEGDSLAPYVGDGDAVISAVDSFLNDRADATPVLAPPAPGGFATILFTDMEGSTTLADRLGDNKAQEVRRTHNDIVRAALNANAGSEIKHTGDGIMASFPSAVSAVTAALQIQRGLAGGEVRVRVGLNAGEPIAEDDDLFGLSVTLAARIGDWGEPGQVLVSDVVRQLLLGKGFEFTLMGEAELKGFDEPVALFEVGG